MVLAKYLRLSKDDFHYKKESNSITNQRLLIEQYIKTQEDLRDMQLLEFVDDGFTGTNFERPGFSKMMELVKKNKVDSIIVKDLSRFGRNESGVSEYLEQVFPFLNVRFISINDHFDTICYKGNISKMHVSLINIFNEYISLDLSFKIKSSIYSKRNTGEHIGSSYPYGFCKKAGFGNQLYLDYQAAEVVKKIFKMTLEGKGRSEIVRMLNEEGTLSPRDYKRWKKCQENNTPFQKQYYWYADQITNILKNEEYIGIGISGKFYRPIIGKAYVKSIPKEAWIRMPNAHEAIVSGEDFEKVQKMMQSKKVDFTQKNGIFTGFLCCGYCNHHLKIRRKKEDIRYYCDSYRLHSDVQCPHETYTEEELIAMITPIIDKQIQVLSEFNMLRMEKQQAQKMLEKGWKENRKKMEAEKRFIKMKQKQNYEDYKMQHISKELYLLQKNQYSICLQELGTKKQIKPSIQVNEEQWIFSDMLERNCFNGKLTREILHDFVKKIVIYGRENIMIEYRFTDQFTRMKKELNN